MRRTHGAKGIQWIHIQAAISPAEVHSENESTWMRRETTNTATRWWAALNRTISQYCSFSHRSVFHFLHAIGSDLILVCCCLFFRVFDIASDCEHGRVPNCASSSNKRSNALARKGMEIRKLHENSSTVRMPLARRRAAYWTLFRTVSLETFHGNCTGYVANLNTNFLSSRIFIFGKLYSIIISTKIFRLQLKSRFN